MFGSNAIFLCRGSVASSSGVVLTGVKGLSGRGILFSRGCSNDNYLALFASMASVPGSSCLPVARICRLSFRKASVFLLSGTASSSLRRLLFREASGGVRGSRAQDRRRTDSCRVATVVSSGFSGRGLGDRVRGLGNISSMACVSPGRT